MRRAIVLIQWEMKRLLRSRFPVLLIPAVPVVCSMAARLIPNLRNHSPELLGFSVIFGWLILYMRHLADRASGFADWIDSSPAAGASVYVAHLIVGLLVTITQTVIFCGITRVL